MHFTIKEFNKRLKHLTNGVITRLDFTIKEFNKRLKLKLKIVYE